MRFEIRVKPGARRTGVGGHLGDALIVRVSARAVGGAATDAALDAVADALGLPRRNVRLVAGATSRTKIIEVDSPHPSATARRLAELAARDPDRPHRDTQ